MKLKNNNKEVIRRITRRSQKENRVNNLFAILAIVLTTFMISTIFTVGISMTKNYSEMDLRLQGTTANVILSAPSKKQIDALRSSDKIESAGIMVQAGTIVDKRLAEKGNETQLTYYDDNVYKGQIRPCIDRVDGTYPKEANEVMISRLSLELLGKSGAKVGDSITVRVKLPQGEKETSIKISGIFSEFGFDQATSHMFVSADFVKEQGLMTSKYTTAQIDLNSKYTDNAEDTMAKIAPAESGQEYTYLFDVEHENKTTKQMTIVVILILVVFIMFSGYLFIYNILYIAVKKHIQFYGLLKTIGTSPKQLKSIVRGQVYRLACIGIPVGMALGLAVSFVVLPEVIRTMSSDVCVSAISTDISFHPIVFIGTALFSLLTIVISVKRPAQIASKIAPTESLHYSGVEERKKGRRRGLHGGKLYKLAWHNVFREKKRAIIVFLSLFMGITTFLMVEAFLDGMKIENYVNAYMPYDFEIEQKDATRKIFKEDTMQQITSLDGVKEAEIVKQSYQMVSDKEPFIDSLIRETLHVQGLTDEEGKKERNKIVTKDGKIECRIYGIADKYVEDYNKKAKKKIDLTEFREGTIALVYPERCGTKQELDETKIVGDTLTFSAPKTDNKTAFRPVLLEKNHKGIPEEEGSLLGMPTIYISLTALDKLDDKATNLSVSLLVEEKKEAQIKSSVDRIAKKNSLEMEAKTTRMQEFKDGMRTLQLIGAGISFLLILIGILNFVNVMITGVYIRFKELAVMESIGMTKKQVGRMLMIEGFYYAIVTSALVGTIGMVIVRKFAILGTKMADYAVVSMPWKTFGVLLVIVVGICMITPILVYRIAAKQTITERLRTE